MLEPFNEMKQLQRRAAVLAVLQQDNLSAWARNYWGVVFDTLRTTEERYNAQQYQYTYFKNNAEINNDGDYYDE